MFLDLNIPLENFSSPHDLAELVELMKRLGYGGFALNKKVSGKLDISSCSFPVYTNTPEVPYMSLLHLENRPFRQLTRITYILESPGEAHALNSANNSFIRNVDILAVEPQNEKSFNAACTTVMADIISLDLSRKLDYPLKISNLQQAIERGIIIEISLGPLFFEKGFVRRNIIANANQIAGATRGKGIIITSKAESILDIRTPHDLMNLASLFGLSPEERKSCLTAAAEEAVNHGESRKSFRSVFKVSSEDDVAKGEMNAVTMEINADE